MRGAQPVVCDSLANTWASCALHETAEKTDKPSRTMFALSQRDGDREAEIASSLTHRTVVPRVRFVDLEHTYYSKGKRKADGEPVQITVHKTWKSVRQAFNRSGGAARLVYNKALEFIKRQPASEQIYLYNSNKLGQILLTEKSQGPRPARLPLPGEPPEKYEKYLAGKAAARLRVEAACLAFPDENLIRKYPFLRDVDSRVLQQSLKCLCDSFHAALQKQKKDKRLFKMGFKKRSLPSGWTFTLPAQSISARHVERPVAGRAVLKQPQPQQKPAVWTQLTLPAALGGNAGVHNKKPEFFHSMVFLTQKVDIEGNKLLADVDFTRDRLRRWHVHCQRKALDAPRAKPAELRRTAFLDPGSRTANTVYLPDFGQVAELLAGEGGAARLFSLCLKVDGIITAEKALDACSTEFKNLKVREHRLRMKIFHLTRDAHIRMAAFIWSRADTAVVPVFDTHRVCRKPQSALDPRRKLTSKTARQLFCLRHGAFRDRMRHSADTMGKEYVNESEEYTTVGCPSCFCTVPKFSGSVFFCPSCQYQAPRDMKSGLMLAIKCLKAD